VDGVSVDGVRGNDVMRRKIHTQMNHLKAAIDSALEDMPRRKIRMAAV
jgi:hypothetical protein